MNPKKYWREVRKAMKESMWGRFQLFLMKKTKKEKEQNKDEN